jgi:hypothetical protein
MNFSEQVEAVIRATTFHSRMSYSWFGKLSPHLHASVRRALTPQIERKCLLYNLQFQLYKDFYCRGFPSPAEQEVINGQDVGVTSFVRQLSVANAGNGYCSDGWSVHTVKGCNVVVRGAGLKLWVRPRDCLIPRDALLKSGTRLGLRFPKELLSISPGFYVALGDKELVGDSSQALVRFYWNLTPEGSISFMRKATFLLNKAEVPFKIKVVNDPVRFTRRDAVVLYIRKVDYRQVSKPMERIYPQVVRSLKNGEPAFTKQLAMGVGLAEDPGQGESFGSHRCRILAEGLVRAYEQRKKSVQEQLQVVTECFQENGINLNKPFVTSAVVDDYDFRPQLRRAANGRTKSFAPESGLGPFLQTATEIGQRLVEDAVWYEGCCNWMGIAEGGPRPDKVLPTRKYSALGPDLYSGTSGVALFLSELHSAKGHIGARRCALGAIHQSLSRFDAIEPQARFGLYTGGMGVALAAACVGKVLRENELLERAARMVRSFVCVDQVQCEFDFISGNAGAVTALILLRDLLDDESLLKVAIRIGDDLLRSAEKSGIGYSWRSLLFRGRKNLTGFAHGTAGVGFALMELFRVTGRSQYREGAEQAFNYERHWFDIEACNWPDFRDEPGESKRTKRPLRFSSAWCHGAPGIALSRLRAYEIIKDPKYKEEAIAALQTTCRITKTWLHSGTGNYSLCHGLSGNAEILLYGWQVLGQDFVEGLATAHAVATARIANSMKHSGLAPCRGEDTESPGLMLGLAGIGYFYLRLYNHSTRSVLSLVTTKL